MTSKKLAFSALTIFFLISLSITASTLRATDKIVWPNTKAWLFRLTLADKAYSPYSLDKPKEFLSERSISRRERQNIALDSTDLPVSPRYISVISEQNVKVVGQSKWNNSVLVSTNDSSRVFALMSLPFIKEVKLVNITPDSISPVKRSILKETLNPWDSVPSSVYGSTEKQIAMLNGIKLHEAGFRGKGKIIAVVDGGFMNVDRLKSFYNVRIYGTKDFVNPPVGEFYSAFRPWHQDLLGNGCQQAARLRGNCSRRCLSAGPE